MGYSPWSRKELDMTEHAYTHTHATAITSIKAPSPNAVTLEVGDSACNFVGEDTFTS